MNCKRLAAIAAAIAASAALLLGTAPVASADTGSGSSGTSMYHHG